MRSSTAFISIGDVWQPIYGIGGSFTSYTTRTSDLRKTGSLQLPSSIGMYNNVTWEGANPDELTEIIHNRVDYDFLDTYEIELLEGRNFSKEFPTDLRGGVSPESPRSIIINRKR